MNEVERMVRKYDRNKYSHVIICQDSFSYEYFPVYVSYEENIHREINTLIKEGNGFTKIMEIYNYNLNIDSQLKEYRTYHIEPIINEVNKKIKDALDYATIMHKGQKRIDGKDYITHPIAVANNVKKFKQSKNITTLIICAYLHDTIEDTQTTYYDIINKFGPLVASIVLELTTDEDLKNELGKTKYLKIKMKNMSNWALVLKLCDRLSNIADLNNCTHNFKNKYIAETIEIINYLINNRKLSNTHKEIIKAIINKIKVLTKNIELNILEKKLITYNH